MLRKVLSRLALLGGLLSASVLAGCTPKALTGEPVDLYALQGGLRQRPAPELESAGPAVGPEAPYVPVMKPPRVQRVWTPAYVNDAGDLVAGHWVYLLLQPSRWFLEERTPEPENPFGLSVPSGLAVQPPNHLLMMDPGRRGGGARGAAAPDREQPRR